jgi:hypothetical protein
VARVVGDAFAAVAAVVLTEVWRVLGTPSDVYCRFVALEAGIPSGSVPAESFGSSGFGEGCGEASFCFPTFLALDGLPCEDFLFAGVLDDPKEGASGREPVGDFFKDSRGDPIHRHDVLLLVLPWASRGLGFASVLELASVKSEPMFNDASGFDALRFEGQTMYSMLMHCLLN